jgi:cytochrome c-type biogenesis protein CcmH/NrfG
MTRDSWALGLAGVFFGVLIGWIIGSQSRTDLVAPVAPAAASASTTQQAPAGNPTAPSQATPATLDENQVRGLTEQATQRPTDAAVRSQLGNLYFDAERYSDAIKWYEASLTVNPRDANVSTDLAVSYYYTNQTDRALQQFGVSLGIDPKHLKTLLNMGMVKAFGKQDLNGATEAWQEVVKLAPPDSPEGRAARQALESVKAAHPDTPGAASGGSAPPPAGPPPSRPPSSQQPPAKQPPAQPPPTAKGGQ